MVQEVEALPPDLAEQLNVKAKEGVVITRVKPGSLADGAGLESGTVITQANRKPVKTPEDLRQAIQQQPLEKGLLLLVLCQPEAPASSPLAGASCWYPGNAASIQPCGGGRARQSKITSSDGGKSKGLLRRILGRDAVALRIHIWRRGPLLLHRDGSPAGSRHRVPRA
jgi:hypothetical protein